MTKTIAVIGSGMTGLVTALSLSKYEYEVTIFSSNIKGEASKAAAGILFPLYPWKNSENMVQLCLQGKVLFDNYLENLNKKEQEKISYQKKNLILLDENNEALNFYQKSKINFLSQKIDINNFEPCINYNQNDFIVVKDISCIDTSNLMKYMEVELKKANVQFIKKKINKTSELKKFDHIIVCAGAWSKSITNKNISLYPIKGQIIKVRSESQKVRNIILENGIYIMQRPDNISIIGATVENVGFDLKKTEEAKKLLLDQYERRFDKNYTFLDHLVGFRPTTIDNYPHIIKCNDNPKIIYNFGHNRYGVLTSFASAQIVYNLINEN